MEDKITKKQELAILEFDDFVYENKKNLGFLKSLEWYIAKWDDNVKDALVREIVVNE